MRKIIAIANQKGGVGKTTTAVNLAASLGACGKRTLLCDLDPQGNSTSGNGINKRETGLSVYDLLINRTPAREVILHTGFENLDLLPSSMDLAGAEVEMAGIEHRETLLKDGLLPVGEEYDYILIDCPPSLGFLTINALAAADTLLIPVQCEYYALEGLSQLMMSVRQVKRLYNPHLDIEGVLLTMFDGRLNLTQQVVQEIKRFFPSQGILHHHTEDRPPVRGPQLWAAGPLLRPEEQGERGLSESGKGNDRQSYREVKAMAAKKGGLGKGLDALFTENGSDGGEMELRLSRDRAQPDPAA